MKVRDRILCVTLIMLGKNEKICWKITLNKYSDIIAVSKMLYNVVKEDE